MVQDEKVQLTEKHFYLINLCNLIVWLKQNGKIFGSFQAAILL
jgi:hypothetical protein